MALSAQWTRFVARYSSGSAYWYTPKGATADSDDFREKFRVFDQFEGQNWAPEIQARIARELRAKGLSTGGNALPRQLKRVFENLGLCWIADNEPLRVTPAGKAFLREESSRHSVTLDSQVWRYQLPNPVNSSAVTLGIALHPHAFLVEVLLGCDGHISGEEFVLFISRAQSTEEVSGSIDLIQSWRALPEGTKQEVRGALRGSNYRTINRDHTYALAFHHCDLLLRREASGLYVAASDADKLRRRLELHKRSSEIIDYRNEPDFIASTGDTDFEGSLINALDYYVDVSNVVRAVEIYRQLPPEVRGELSPEDFARSQFLEKDLEDYLERHLDDVEPGLRLIGRQYSTKVGPIDLYAKSASGDLVVLELKKGRAADKVFGQICRYMGCIKSELPSKGAPRVRGYIVGREIDEKLRYAARIVSKGTIGLQTFEVPGEKGEGAWIRITST